MDQKRTAQGAGEPENGILAFFSSRKGTDQGQFDKN
jgi:hypothetical protein